MSYYWALTFWLMGFGAGGICLYSYLHRRIWSARLRSFTMWELETEVRRREVTVKVRNPFVK